MRDYIAFYTDGHDNGYFEFASDHRAGSKANREDAFEAAANKYGWRRARQLEFTSIYKIDY